ncbi:MAG TPA: hypothetical protein VFP58_14550 [Candidatus Eisenbacteria bacterium]|nr:hypothetical protein [Candidatus Eisenbacteria bacterium]
MATGSFASSYHGRSRMTQDIDLVIAPTPDQLRTFVRSLPPSDYYVVEETALEALASEDQFNLIELASGWKVDFIIRKSRPFSRTEFDRRVRAEIDGFPMYVASAEDILIAKLEWARKGGSERQIEDAAGILGLRGEELDLKYIERWIVELGLQDQLVAARKMIHR